MAITLKNPASDLAAAMTGQTVGGQDLVSGTNLFFRFLHPTPKDLAVYLLNTGGQAPDPYISPTASARFIANVQCLIYGPPGEDGFDLGQTLARGVVGYLQQASVSGYVRVTAIESQPTHLVDPETQRHIFTSNFTAEYVA